MNVFFQIAIYFLLFYGICVVFMYMKQDSFLFFPPSSTHKQHNYQHVTNYSLERGGATIRGWLVNPKQVKEKLIIYFGGNAEDVFLNIDEFSDIHAASLFVAYRGYGPSSGTPGEKDFFADALAIIDDVNVTYSPKQIVLIGRSLGSGVACFAAAHRRVQGIVLVTPYDSIENIARAHYPWLPIGLLLKHRFLSIDYVDKLHCPAMIVYGGNDTVIPPKRTENLIRHISGEKEIIYIEHADHGNIEMFPEYWSALLRFLDQTTDIIQEHPGE